MLRKLLKLCAIVLALVLCAGIGLWLNARHTLQQSYAHIALPQIHADTSAQGVARGELLFQSLCIECHGGPDGRATGKRLEEVPAFLGTFYSANLAHPERGVHRRTDGEIARVLRSGVLPDGRLSPAMGGFSKLGDTDVAALLGYMRSGAPPFAPGGALQPRSELTPVGALILTYVAGVHVDAPAQSVPVPPKAANLEYGRYMTTAMDCGTCHTSGFASDKLEQPGAFAGGFELTDPTGTTIYSKNITFDPDTGIGRWSLDDFQRAVTRGVNKQGYSVRKPMPLFARLDRTDIEAIYLYLQSLPKVNQANRAGGHPLKKAEPSDSAEAMFVNVGCAACHGQNGPHRDKLSAALDKSDDDVARWILDPQAIKPGSAMPSFAGTLDRAQAERLAAYVKQLARGPRG